MPIEPIKIPKILSADNINPLLRLCYEIRSNDEVILDASEYSYASPIGMTLLKAAIHSGHDCRCKDIIWMDRTRASYLKRMDFFEDVLSPSIVLADSQRNDRSDRLIELQKLLSDIDVDDCASMISRALSRSLIREASRAEIKDFDEGLITHPISYLISEILLNATTHSKRHGYNRSKAWISAQAREATRYRPAQIEIAIVDDGCGVYRTLADQLNGSNDIAAAIELSMKPMVSCNFGVDFNGEKTSNQGVGLYVAKDLILKAGGRLQIISDNCMYDSDQNHRRKQFRTMEHSWSGVAIGITIPFDNIYGLSPSDSLDKIHIPRQSGVNLNFL